MSETWTIAKKMIQEAIRRRTPLVLLFFILFLIPSLPFVLRDDGTLTGKMQLILNYSLILAVTLLSLQSIFLAISSFTGEIRTRQIFLVDTKPVARWQFFWGKFVGLGILNLVFLTVIGSFILVGLFLGYQQAGAKEKKALQQELFMAAQGILPDSSEEAIQRRAEAQYRQLALQDRLPEGRTPAEVKKDLANLLLHQSRAVNYGEYLDWTFSGLPLALRNSPEAQLRIRFKVYTSKSSATRDCRVNFIVGKVSRYSYSSYVPTGEYTEFSVPPDAIDSDGTVWVRFINQQREAGVFYFPPPEGIELLYPASSFFSNYAKALVMIFFVLCFLVLVALFASTFLSFPVATLFSLYILFLGSIAEFVLYIIKLGITALTVREDSSLWQAISQKVLLFSYQIIPNFSQYIPLNHLATGRVIAWESILQCFLVLLFLKGGLLGLCGCWIFRNREIGKPLL